MRQRVDGERSLRRAYEAVGSKHSSYHRPVSAVSERAPHSVELSCDDERSWS